MGQIENVFVKQKFLCFFYGQQVVFSQYEKHFFRRITS